MSDTVTPNWAVSDEDVRKIIPESGFIHDYILHAGHGTDAPLIFHYGTIMTVLSCAVSGADILCQQSNGSKKDYKIPSPMWSALIGQSGASRKSSCMNKAVGLLVRAKSITADPDILLPGDGSLEGWHDFMCEHNEVLLHRDEFSVLFDQARRGYSEGLKNWFMEIHSGYPKRRATRKDQAAKETKIIERPRLSILGGIPPEVFKRVVGAGDWNSGFLARFAFWPGERQWFNPEPWSSGAKETELSSWLLKWALSVAGYIYVDPDTRRTITDWFVAEVEDRRQDLPPGLYSHFVRYQDLGLRLAAMHAVGRGRSGKKDAVEAVKADGEHAIKVLALLMRATENIFNNSGKEPEREEEDDLIQIIKKYGKPIKLDELVMRCSMSRVTLWRRLKTLIEADSIQAKKEYNATVGRRATLYSA